MPIAPMIDCVFLMLVYFMTTSSLEKAEAEMLVKLASSGQVSEDPIPAVDNQTIKIDARGRAILNGYIADEQTSGWRPGLTKQLKALRLTAKRADSTLNITVDPDDQTPHSAIVDVLDSLHAAGVESVRFL